LRFFLCVLCACASSGHIGLSSAVADDWQLGGHAKYQYTYTGFRRDDLAAVLGDDPARDHDGELRLKGEWRSPRWEAAAHYELLALSGDSIEVRRRLAALGLITGGPASGLPDDRRRLFDLTGELGDRERRAVVHRLDRLYAGYRGARLSLRLGRQAVSWGNGLVFQPLDFVNPFSPIAIDKDYKTGDDMLHAQWLAGTGADAQAIVVPRRDPITRDIESRESSYAVKFRARLGAFDLDLLAARHYEEDLAALGVVRSVGGAVWRLDMVHADLARGGGAWSYVSNLDYSWSWGGRHVYGYAEYFRSGVGESDAARYAAPNAPLAARIARGELYTLARDYLAAGLRVELTPLLNVFASVLRNLNDGSRFVQLRGVYDWRQDAQLLAGVNLPTGERGEEFGGIPSGVPGAYLAAGKSVYLGAAYYF
jgi:hypothetical protein